MRPMAVREALARRVPLPRLRARQGLGAWPRHAADRVRRLPPPDLGDRRDGAAPQPPAAAHLVPGGLARGDAPERDVGAAAVAPARARLLQDRLAAPAEATPRDGRPRAGTLGRPGRGRRDQPPLPRQGRARPAGALARRQAPVAGAAEIRGKGPGRVRLVVIEDYSAATLGGFVAGNVAAGSTVVSDGWSGYARLTDVKHEPTVIGDTPAHLILPWVHRVFANAKRRALGARHGLREGHLQAYLDEFVFRFNRRRTPAAAFERLLGLAVTLQPAPYQMLISRS